MFCRALVMVTLVSTNTYQIAHGHLTSAGAVSMAISVLWFYNARKAAHSPLPYAGWVYGFGAGVGTLLAVWAAPIIWGGK